MPRKVAALILLSALAAVVWSSVPSLMSGGEDGLYTPPSVTSSASSTKWNRDSATSQPEDEEFPSFQKKSDTAAAKVAAPAAPSEASGDAAGGNRTWLIAAIGVGILGGVGVGSAATVVLLRRRRTTQRRVPNAAVFAAMTIKVPPLKPSTAYDTTQYPPRRAA